MFKKKIQTLMLVLFGIKSVKGNDLESPGIDKTIIPKSYIVNCPYNELHTIKSNEIIVI